MVQGKIVEVCVSSIRSVPWTSRIQGQLLHLLQKERDFGINQYDYRPVFDLHPQCWLLHRRLVCKKEGKHGFGRTFAEIDPRFLEQLPTRVVERLIV